MKILKIINKNRFQAIINVNNKMIKKRYKNHQMNKDNISKQNKI